MFCYLQPWICKLNASYIGWLPSNKAVLGTDRFCNINIGVVVYQSDQRRRNRENWKKRMLYVRLACIRLQKDKYLESKTYFSSTMRTSKRSTQWTLLKTKQGISDRLLMKYMCFLKRVNKSPVCV